MPRGDYRQTIRCADQPCPEKITYHHLTRADEAASVRDQQARPWRCSRHSKPAEVLGPEQQAITTVMTVTPRPNAARWDSPLIWAAPGRHFRSDKVSGPGFMAFAGDWPEGTRLEITARILPPAGPAAELETQLQEGN
jgi:hypothetical protein